MQVILTLHLVAVAVAHFLRQQQKDKPLGRALWLLGGGRHGGSHMASSLFPRTARKGCRDTWLSLVDFETKTHKP